MWENYSVRDRTAVLKSEVEILCSSFNNLVKKLAIEKFRLEGTYSLKIDADFVMLSDQKYDVERFHVKSLCYTVENEKLQGDNSSR